MTDILIIEDDPEMGSLIRDFMINEGFSAMLCAAAEEALELLDGENFGLVLLDVMLPEMNGYETCTAIREKQDIPILMMSAMTDEDSKLESALQSLKTVPLPGHILARDFLVGLSETGMPGTYSVYRHSHLGQAVSVKEQWDKFQAQ